MKEQNEELFKTETEIETGIEKVLETEIVAEPKIEERAKEQDTLTKEPQNIDSFGGTTHRLIISNTETSRNQRHIIAKRDRIYRNIQKHKIDKQPLLPMEEFGIKELENNTIQIVGKNKKGEISKASAIRVIDYNVLGKQAKHTTLIQLLTAIDTEIFNNINLKKKIDISKIPDIELNPDDFIKEKPTAKYPLYASRFEFYRALSQTYKEEFKTFFVRYETTIMGADGKPNKLPDGTIEKGWGFGLLYDLIITPEQKIYIRVNKNLTKENLKQLKFGSYTKATTHILDYTTNIEQGIVYYLIDFKKINNTYKKKYNKYPLVKIKTILNYYGILTKFNEDSPTKRIIEPVIATIKKINEDSKIDFKIAVGNVINKQFRTIDNIKKMRLDKFLDLYIKIFDN